MTAYVIAEVDVHDVDRYQRYRELVPPSLAPYGGRFVVRGGRTESLEGGWSPPRLVVLEFADIDTARAWWSSVEYAEAKALRQAIASTRMVLVEGA
ncbi:MAG: DUF1330 domain-containing protein [Ectothiorhodospiraceae bacterium]|nr:DUF1330 domain-containing protein [Ectothiorhodospiraceae bacterium]